MTKDELDLIETKDLVETLRRRSKALVLILLHGISEPTKKMDEGSQAKEWWALGGHFACLGLVESTKSAMLRNDYEDAVDCDDDAGDDWKNGVKA